MTIVPKLRRSTLTLHVRPMPNGWHWLILERDGQALELIDTARNRTEAQTLARRLADAHGWTVAP